MVGGKVWERLFGKFSGDATTEGVGPVRAFSRIPEERDDKLPEITSVGA